MHTHFGSATALVGAFLSVVVVGGFWRLIGLHGLTSSNPHVRGLSRAMLFQY